MEAQVVEFDYYKSTPAYKLTGVKKGQKVPKNAHGSNGTYIVPGDPPKVIVTVKYGKDRYGTVDLYHQLKQMRPEKKLTERYAREQCKKLMGQTVEVAQDNYRNPEIKNLFSYL